MTNKIGETHKTTWLSHLMHLVYSKLSTSNLEKKGVLWANNHITLLEVPEWNSPNVNDWKL